METKLQIFEHPKFGKMRIMMKNDAPWFGAVDTCDALEVKNSRDAVSSFFLRKMKSSTRTGGGFLLSLEPYLKRLENFLTVSSLFSMTSE